MEKYYYKYNLKGYKVEETYYSPDGEHLFYKLLYKYDKKGNKIELAAYDSNNDLYFIMSYEYSYDEKGNWINRISYDNNMPDAITEREIKYF